MYTRSVRRAVRALAAAGARHVAAGRRAAAARPARPAARLAGAARGRLAADAAQGECDYPTILFLKITLFSLAFFNILIIVKYVATADSECRF